MVNERRRILVVKLSDIGDVLTATPTLRALRHTFPTARLDVLLPPNSAPVLAASPLVDELLIFDKFQYDRPLDALRPAALVPLLRLALTLRRRYDTVLILHHLTTRWGTLKFAALALSSGARCRAGLDNGRGWFLTHRLPDAGFGDRHEVEYCLGVAALLGATTDNLRMEITVPSEDDAFAYTLLQEAKGASGCATCFVAVHPGSGGDSLARRWLPERFARVADTLADRHRARVVLVGTANDGVDRVAGLMHSQPLNLAGQTTLPQLAAVLRRCRLFVGADSGVMHLAAAVGTSLVAIFGPSNHRAWGPWTPGGRSAVVRVEEACSPCSYVGFALRRAGCDEMRCMKAVTVDMVLDAAERVWENG